MAERGMGQNNIKDRAETVQKRTGSPPTRDFGTRRGNCPEQNGGGFAGMLSSGMTRKRKRAKTEPVDPTRVGVKIDMTKPRMSRSARIAELKLDTTRVPERPSATMPGTVDKIIPSSRSNQPERAQIGVNGPDRRYRDLRIDNALTDEHGDDVKLKKGEHVDVTVTAEPKTSIATLNEDN
jgi:hypothetical protein